MQVRKHFRRTALAAVAAVAVGAPAASAMPIQDGGGYVPAGASQDMHASTVQPGLESTVTGGDLRTEATKSTAGTRIDSVDAVAADLRTEATKSTAGTRIDTGDVLTADLRTEAARSPLESRIDTGDVLSADLRTEAAKVPVTAPEPVTATDGGGDPVDWPLVGLLLAGTLALAGAALVVSRRPAGHAH
ncbi:MAG TPA: hypothetical protein VD836_04775 [Solirubrobacteraceae bacterium]|nr:hypothetical protein [Solirubrobacteraceae bacterium]